MYTNFPWDTEQECLLLLVAHSMVPGSQENLITTTYDPREAWLVMTELVFLPWYVTNGVVELEML